MICRKRKLAVTCFFYGLPLGYFFTAGIVPLSLAKNGVIICVNLRGLRDNYMPAELAEIRRHDIYKIQGDNSDFLKSAVTIKKIELPLAFAEDAFPERIEPHFHNDSDNQLLNRRNEVDEPKDSDKIYTR